VYFILAIYRSGKNYCRGCLWHVLCTACDQFLRL